jgi:hypothetical protein
MLRATEPVFRGVAILLLRIAYVGQKRDKVRDLCDGPDLHEWLSE